MAGVKAYWSARMTKAWAHKSYDDFTLKGKLRAFLRQKKVFCLAPSLRILLLFLCRVASRFVFLRRFL